AAQHDAATGLFCHAPLAVPRGERMLSSQLACSALRRTLQSPREVMSKKFIIAWIVLFVAWFLGSFVVHGVLLGSDYMQLTNLFRGEGDAHEFFPLMIVAHLMLSGAFVWIYTRGAEAKPWMA